MQAHINGQPFSTAIQRGEPLHPQTDFKAFQARFLYVPLYLPTKIYLSVYTEGKAAYF